MAVLRTAWRLLLGVAAISCLAAMVVLSGEGGGASPAALQEQEAKRGYLGDNEALSSDESRKQADSYFDTQIHTAMKLKARHNLSRKGMNSDKARNDLNDFFNTLGLTESHQDPKPKAQDKQVNQKQKGTRATTVNVYINEKVKQKKAALKAHALAKKIKEAKSASATDYGKEDGLPLPMALKAQTTAKKPLSNFDKEMLQAKSLLKSSKMEKALSQARTLSLKADAPYYTSR